MERGKMKKQRIRELFLCLGLVATIMASILVSGCTCPTSCKDKEWYKKFGTEGEDVVNALGTDADNHVYGVGTTDGEFSGQENYGSYDGFVRKYNGKCGKVMWTRQFGTDLEDKALGVAVADSQIFIIGYTYGNFSAAPPFGGANIFMIVFDKNGNELLRYQYGTEKNDFAMDIDIDRNGIYITGYTEGQYEEEPSFGGKDGFVLKLDRDFIENSNVEWVTQFGTENDEVINGISVVSNSDPVFNLDPNGIYVTGFRDYLNSSDPNEKDVITYKFGPNGTIIWDDILDIGIEDGSNDIEVGDSKVFIIGETFGSKQSSTGFGFGVQPANDKDWNAFIVAYEFNGVKNWTWSSVITTNRDDLGAAVTAGCSGALGAGSTNDAFDGQTNHGDDDPYLYWQASPAMTSYATQYGKGESEMINDLTCNELGNFLGGQVKTGDRGGYEALVMKVK